MKIMEESIIINFFKTNSEIFQQPKFPKELYKTRKHDYFIKHKKTVGKPKDSKISKIIVSYLIKNNVIKNEEELAVFLELPFFKKNIFNKDMFYEEIKLKNSNSEVIIDPSKIKKAEYVTGLKKKFKDEAITESAQDLHEQKNKVQEKIRQKKKELESIPTRLDDTEIEEPAETKANKDHLEWWQVLNLKEDPIPDQEGFQRIDTGYYDNIVVKTNIFGRYVNYSNNLQDQIFKNTVFYGEFGSGKTSFFDYLKQTLSKNKILELMRNRPKNRIRKICQIFY